LAPDLARQAGRHGQGWLGVPLLRATAAQMPESGRCWSCGALRLGVHPHVLKVPQPSWQAGIRGALGFGFAPANAHLEMFSLPAKSTKFSLPTLTTSSPAAVVSFIWMVMVKMLCERLERLLSRVAAVRRLAVPRSSTCSAPAAVGARLMCTGAWAAQQRAGAGVGLMRHQAAECIHTLSGMHWSFSLKHRACFQPAVHMR